MNAGPGHDELMDYHGGGPRPRLDAEALAWLHDEAPELRDWLREAWPSRRSAAWCERRPEVFVNTAWLGSQGRARPGASVVVEDARGRCWLERVAEPPPETGWPRLVYTDAGRRRARVPGADDQDVRARVACRLDRAARAVR